jgi:DNA-binding XRE family transcriptional regulator
MSGRHKWSDIRKKASPRALARAETLAQQMLAEMPLHELRRARHLSQQTLAKAMGTSQPEISNLERRTDTYVSTLRSYVEAMGGQLDIVAHFPEGDYRINQFSEIGDEDLKEA